MHTYCFDLFKRYSQQRFGSVNIDGLFTLWVQQGDFRNRFEGFPITPDLDIVKGDGRRHLHVPGTEYLVANPVHIQGLDELLQACILDKAAPQKRVAFTTLTSPVTARDPFAALPPELKLMVLLNLGVRDVCNLRLASRSFVQLPLKFFREAVRAMSWVWEQERLEGKSVDWHLLCLKLSQADGRPDRDQAERERLYCHEARLERYDYGYSGKDLCAPGPHWPKPTELRGLRNRRRIYNDIQEIFDRIDALEEGVGYYS